MPYRKANTVFLVLFFFLFLFFFSFTFSLFLVSVVCFWFWFWFWFLVVFWLLTWSIIYSRPVKVSSSPVKETKVKAPSREQSTHKEVAASSIWGGVRVPSCPSTYVNHGEEYCVGTSGT